MVVNSDIMYLLAGVGVKSFYTILMKNADSKDVVSIPRQLSYRFIASSIAKFISLWPSV